MKFHSSHHEEDLKWINIYVELPEPSVKVLIAFIRIIDWNMEELIWESEGWITKGGNWSVKMTALVVNDTSNKFIVGVNDKPTHWKEIEK